MPGMPPPAVGDRQTLLNFVAFQQNAFFAVSYGLTDDDARSTPTMSALSIGGLIKHVTSMQRGWTQRAASAPGFPPPDPRPLEEQMAEHGAEHTVRQDETLAGLLDGLREQNAHTLAVFADADLDAAVPVPRNVPWFPKDIDHWSVRWVAMHLVEEMSRHAGHADIIRESIDGATMYELMAGVEGWPETRWIKPWKPATAQ